MTTVDYDGSVVETRALTSQEEMLLHDRRLALSMVDGAGDHLDTKALGLLQAASLVLALVMIVGLPARLPGLAGLALVGLVVALLAFGAMVALAVVAWYPRDYSVPGTDDWETTWERYLLADTTSVVAQVLANYNGLIAMFSDRNKIKGRAVIGAGVLFIVQIVGLLLLAVGG